MPDLNTKLHLDMLKNWKNRDKTDNRFALAYKMLTIKNENTEKHPNFRIRLRKAINILIRKHNFDNLYGLNWGDPDEDPSLKYVRDHFLLPYVSPDSTVMEIGPGGGRWTRYLLSAAKIYAVDYHQELLGELKSNFDAANISYIKNCGYDFPQIEDSSIDFLFSFGTFVHLDVEIIDKYLYNMKKILKRRANSVIQYSDKTKPLARRNEGFSENDPEKMRHLILAHGYEIIEEDLTTLLHSSIVRFRPPDFSN